MKNYFLTGAIILLSLSIFYCGFQIGKYNENNINGRVSDTSPKDNSGLLTLEETAKYLSVSTEEFKKILIKDDSVRALESVYDTYRFIPYIKVDGKKYFNKAELEEWIKYNSKVHSEYN